MTHQEYSTQQDLNILAKYEAKEAREIGISDKSDWDKRNALIASKSKFNVIREALIGLNSLGIRPSVSVLTIIKEF